MKAGKALKEIYKKPKRCTKARRAVAIHASLSSLENLQQAWRNILLTRLFPLSHQATIQIGSRRLR
ncbi:MAG TPA: hypothetical protein VLK33_13075, partial [Terriglobales bacterium]|nr:hypothetical protein [Terriglobales bacterium]